jgi:hypothetical protein
MSDSPRSISPVLAKAYGLKETTTEQLASDAQYTVNKLVSRAMQLEGEVKQLRLENNELKYGDGEAADQPMLTKDEWTALVNETIGLKTYALDIHDDSKLQHLIHILIGYREYIMTFGEDTQPYSPGSARDNSWRHGRDLAEVDLQKRETNRRRSQSQSAASPA